MLNDKLNLNECLDILNEMLEELEEWDFDDESVIYVIVEGTDRNRDLLSRFIPDKEELEQYLYDYGNGDWREYGIDLLEIWDKINIKFNVDVYFNAKKKLFYINN